MAVGVETVALRKLNIVAGVEIAVAIPVFSAQEVHVSYGLPGFDAVLNVDYTVTLLDPTDFNTFTITPTTVLLGKIEVLMDLDADEVNAIVVRRRLNYLSDSSEAYTKYSQYVSTQFDRTAARFQQLDEKINRALMLPESVVGDTEKFSMGERNVGDVLVVDENLNIVSKPAGELGAAVIGVDVQAHDDELDDFGQITGSKPPFGRGGVRVLAGEENDYHYFAGGMVHFTAAETGDVAKTVILARRGVNHGTRNGSEIVAWDSYDEGQTKVNERVVYKNADDPLLDPHDCRPGQFQRFGGTRCGMLVGRPREEGSPHLDPIALITDDCGVTFSFNTLTRPGGATAYSWVTGQTLFNISVNQPSIPGGGVGGPNAWICYGSMNGGTSLDAGYTLDNFETWNWELDVSDTLPTDIQSYSENDGIVVDADRVLIYFRNKTVSPDDWRNEAVVMKVTDLFNLPTASVDTGVLISGSPPACFADYDTGMGYFLATSRRTQDNYGLVNWALLAGANLEDLWDADGDFGALGVVPYPLMPMPDWFTSYWRLCKIGNTWFGMCTSGEIDNADHSLLTWFGDFVTNGAEAERWNYYLKERQPSNLPLNLLAVDNLATTYPLTIDNHSETLIWQMGAYGASNIGDIALGYSQSSDWTLNLGGDFIINADRMVGNFTTSSIVTGVNYSFNISGWLETFKIRPYSGTLLEINESGDVMKVTGTARFGGLASALTTTAAVQIPVNSSTTPALATNTATASARQHIVLEGSTGPNGQLGTTALHFTISALQAAGNLILTPGSGGFVQIASPLLIPGYTFAGVPSVSTYNDCLIRITDRSNRLAISDGTNWRFMDGVIIS